MDKNQEDRQVKLVSLHKSSGDRASEAGQDRRARFISLQVKLLLGFTLAFSVAFAAAYYLSHSAVVASIITYVTLVILIFLAARALTRPIVTLTQSARRVAEGDYSRGVIPQMGGLLSDETAALAEVFRQMVTKIADRERDLKDQVRELTLTMHIQIDQLKKAKSVAEITESEYFLQLQEKARKMREARRK